MRKKWIEAISQYQDFDYYSARFSLCQLHFEESDIEMKQTKAMLRKGTIPTIFGRPENMLTTNTESVRFRNDPENMDIVPKTEPFDESYADPLAMAAALKFVAFNFNFNIFFIIRSHFQQFYILYFLVHLNHIKCPKDKCNQLNMIVRDVQSYTLNC